MSQNPSPTTPVEWLEPEQLVVFRLTGISRKEIDGYIEDNLTMLKAWDPEKPLYTIQDISAKGVELTPYLQGRLSDVSSLIREREITVTSAIVMQNDFAGQVMRVFGRLFTIRSQYLRQVFFVNYEAAETWIREQLKRN